MYLVINPAGGAVGFQPDPARGVAVSVPGMSSRPAVVLMTLLISFTMTWVGQDYFSPPGGRLHPLPGAVGLLLRERHGGAAGTALFMLSVAAMAVAHQIVLVIVLMSIVALVVTRQTREWSLPAACDRSPMAPTTRRERHRAMALAGQLVRAVPSVLT